MVFRMHNILRRQNEVTEGEKRLKCDYYRKEIKKQNLVTQNNVSIIAPCREVYISLQNPQCETKELWRDVLVHLHQVCDCPGSYGPHLRVFFLNYWQTFSGDTKNEQPLMEMQLMEACCFNLILWFSRVERYTAHRMDQT